MTLQPHALISLPNIVHNWRMLDALNPSSATTAAVVKANAYGLGVGPVAAALSKAGCSTFFVAYREEGEALRRAIGPSPRIFVLNGPGRDSAAAYEKAGLTAVLSAPWQVKAWASAPKGTCALHFDTGMNRLGLRADLLGELGDTLRKLQPVLVMSHLACADEPAHEMNARQKAAFDTICEAFPDTPASLANSAGCFLGKSYAYDLTRPGIALYGGGHAPNGTELKQVVTLDTQILSVFPAKAGETVGYGATHKLQQDALLATVSLGYADGILRAGSGRLLAYLDEIPCPVLGRVSMDLITIDVSKAQARVKAGDRVEFLGQHAKLEDQAARAGTLGYELLTGLGPRVQRSYQQ